MPKTKKPSKATKLDSRATFDALKRLLTRHGTKLAVAKDKPSDYWAVVRGVELRGKPLFFGGVREGKNYVSFHLLPVYACPELLRGLSPALKKRMQGKSLLQLHRARPRALPRIGGVDRRGPGAILFARMARGNGAQGLELARRPRSDRSLQT